MCLYYFFGVLCSVLCVYSGLVCMFVYVCGWVYTCVLCTDVWMCFVDLVRSFVYLCIYMCMLVSYVCVSTHVFSICICSFEYIRVYECSGRVYVYIYSGLLYIYVYMCTSVFYVSMCVYASMYRCGTCVCLCPCMSYFGWVFCAGICICMCIHEYVL